MLLNFPQMHPELLSEAARTLLPEAVRFLDPGLAAADSASHLLPEAAPFDRRTAKALLADTLRFGESVQNPRDIAAQGLAQQYAQAGELASESSRMVQGEVERSLGGVAAQAQAAETGEAAAADVRRQAQMLLLLAWNLEERLLDLRAIEDKLKATWSRLGESVSAGQAQDVAAEDDESDHEALALGRELSGMTLPEFSAEVLPWRRLLEPFAVLAPGAGLCTTEAEIGAALADAGMHEAPLDTVPGATRVFRAAAWRMLGLAHLPEARPWLAAELTLALFPAS